MLDVLPGPGVLEVEEGLASSQDGLGNPAMEENVRWAFSASRCNGPMGCVVL